MILINWLDIEINEKIYKRILIIGIFAIICYVIINYIFLSIPRQYKIGKNTSYDTGNTVKTGINSIYRGKIRLELSGWAYKEGQDIKTFNSCYVLKSVETEKMYILKAEMKNIPQLENVEDKYNCSNAGLDTKSLIFGMKKGVYDIYILYKNDSENLLVNTGIQANI